MKRKKLFIIFAFMFMLLIFCNNSFASTEFQINEMTYTLPDWIFEHEYQLIIVNPCFEINNKYGGFCYVFSSDSPLLLSGDRIVNSDNTDFRANVWYHDLFSEPTYYYDFSENFTGPYIKSESISSIINKPYYYYSTHDVYNGDTLVFQKPVQEIQEITLAQVLETEKQNNPQMVMKELLIILPTILVVVVSYLGLRKALAMLSAILHRS